MPTITQSTYTEGAPEQGGRWVRERHMTDTGTELINSWFGTEDAALVLAARAAEYNRQFAAEEAAAQRASSTMTPLSHLQFVELFPSTAQAQIMALHAQIWTHPGLSTEQRAAINLGWEKFRMASYIRRPFEPAVLQMIGLYQALGFLTAEQAAAVIAQGSLA